MKKAVLLMALLVSVLAVLPGCGDKISKDNYDKIDVGMTQAEVEAILGTGTEQGSSKVDTTEFSMSVKILMWKDDLKIISITFTNGKVMSKAQVGL